MLGITATTDWLQNKRYLARLKVAELRLDKLYFSQLLIVECCEDSSSLFRLDKEIFWRLFESIKDIFLLLLGLLVVALQTVEFFIPI